MAILRRDQLNPPALPKETVEVPALGGEVVVRGLLLSDRFKLHGVAEERYASEILARTVIDADQQPLMSADEWDTWGVGHLDAAMDLVQVAQRLSGLGPEPETGDSAEKNAGPT